LPDDELADLLSEAENRLTAARHLLEEKFYDDAEKFLARLKEAISNSK
jgi:HEPN domain-containing protein